MLYRTAKLRFWGLWILASEMGWLLGCTTWFMVLGFLQSSLGAVLGIGVCGGILGMGALQWLLLRLKLRRARWWVVANLPAAVIGNWVLSSTGNRLDPIRLPTPSEWLFLLPFGLLVGLGLGLAQWPIVKPLIRQTWRWLVVSVLAWMVAASMTLAIVWLLYQIVQSGYPNAFSITLWELGSVIVALLVLGSISSAITGAALLYWL